MNSRNVSSITQQKLYGIAIAYSFLSQRIFNDVIKHFLIMLRVFVYMVMMYVEC